MQQRSPFFYTHPTWHYLNFRLTFWGHIKIVCTVFLVLLIYLLVHLTALCDLFTLYGTKLCFSGVLVAAVPMTDCSWSSGLRAGRWLCPLWPQCAKWVWPYGRSSRSSTPTFWRSTPSFDDSANKVRTYCRKIPSIVDVYFQFLNVFIYRVDCGAHTHWHSFEYSSFITFQV